MSNKLVKTSAHHKRFRMAFLDLLNRHSQDLSDVEVLALVSHTVGQLIALQDQRNLTPNEAMQLVFRNIERGNADTIGDLMAAPVGRPN